MLWASPCGSAPTSASFWERSGRGTQLAAAHASTRHARRRLDRLGVAQTNKGLPCWARRCGILSLWPAASRTCASSDALLQRIPSVPHLQRAWFLLLCARPRSNHLLRVLPPAETEVRGVARQANYTSRVGKARKSLGRRPPVVARVSALEHVAHDQATHSGRQQVTGGGAARNEPQRSPSWASSRPLALRSSRASRRGQRRALVPRCGTARDCRGAGRRWAVQHAGP